MCSWSSSYCSALLTQDLRDDIVVLLLLSLLLFLSSCLSGRIRVAETDYVTQLHAVQVLLDTRSIFSMLSSTKYAWVLTPPYLTSVFVDVDGTQHCPVRRVQPRIHPEEPHKRERSVATVVFGNMFLTRTVGCRVRGFSISLHGRLRVRPGQGEVRSFVRIERTLSTATKPAQQADLLRLMESAATSWCKTSSATRSPSKCVRPRKPSTRRNWRNLSRLSCSRLSISSKSSWSRANRASS